MNETAPHPRLLGNIEYDSDARAVAQREAANKVVNRRAALLGAQLPS
jgi:hypothetical protein